MSRQAGNGLIDRIQAGASTTGWLLRVAPHFFDPIRDDPRFGAALTRIGLGA